jgi:hypothetical protein
LRRAGPETGGHKRSVRVAAKERQAAGRGAMTAIVPETREAIGGSLSNAVSIDFGGVNTGEL